MAYEAHHHQHRPHRLSVPARGFPTIHRSWTSTPASTPTPTPSKQRPFSFSKSKSKSKSSSLSSVVLLLCSLRSLYSLFPFLRSSSPSFSLFPFTFLVSLLSFLLTLSFSLFSSSPSTLNPKLAKPFPLSPLLSKSLLLSLVFLLRFQALRYCGTASMILAEFMGTLASQSYFHHRTKLRACVSLFLGLFLLSFGWDRIECVPFLDWRNPNCRRIWHLLLPFLSGFLASYEQRVSMSDSGTLKHHLGHKRVRLFTLFFTTVMLFVPAFVSFLVFEGSHRDSITFGNLAWPLANTVVFGVLLNENYKDDDYVVSFRDSKREFLVTFVCTLLLELFYFPQVSLWGLLLCGLLLYVAVRDLDPFHSTDFWSGEEFFSDMIMKPIQHVLSERKSRKIALFLLINAGYMVVEFSVGFMSNSLGLISDACHMLFDCAALAIGLYASYISRLPANNHYNYGRGRFEVLSGYANAVFLVLVGALIVVESFERILDPQEISTNSLLVVSIGGLVVNVIGLIFFHEEHHHAHGLSGSCSHSHAHDELHSHHHLDQHCQGEHHHQTHGHNEVVSISGDCQDNSSFSQPGHHHHSSHGGKSECHEDSHSSLRLNHDCSQQHDRRHDHCNHESKVECHVDNHSIQSSVHHDHARDHPCHEASHVHQDHSHRHIDHQDHSHNHIDHQNHSHNHIDHQHHSHHHIDHQHHSHRHIDHKNHSHRHIDHQDHSHRHIDHQDHSHNHIDHKNHSHRHIDHNMEGIFLHVLADTMGSVGVVISTLLIKYKGWLVADPACSIFISILIISSVIPLLRNSAEILLQRVPRVHEHELKDALTNVLKIRGVYGIQKFHLWSFTNTDVVGTLHLHVSTDTDQTSAKSQVLHLLHNAGIKDLTMQLECVV